MLRRVGEQRINLPDVLGYITGGVGTRMGAVQCALAVNPCKVPAGQNFEVLLLIQGLLDCMVDVHVHVLLPAEDANGAKGTFFAKSNKLLLGLRPAEVGVVVLPLSTSPLTAPSYTEPSKPDSIIVPLGGPPPVDTSLSYVLGVAMKVKRTGKGKQVRYMDTPVPFDPDGIDMDEELHTRLKALSELDYSADKDKRSRLVAHFDVIPPTGPGLELNLKPGWESLWTMRDHIDEAVVIEKVGEQATAMLPMLQRGAVFRPLLRRVQIAFKNAGYPLQSGEALFVTKLLTLVLESGTTLGVDMPTPRWYVGLCRLLFTDARATKNIEHLVTKLLWKDLLMDATMLGFSMVATVAHQNLPTFLSSAIGQRVKADEVESIVTGYGQSLVGALSFDEPAVEPMLGFTDAYMPLVLGGLVANTLVTMQGESALDSIHLFEKNRDRRLGEKTAGNARIFDIVAVLLKRGFDLLA